MISLVMITQDEESCVERAINSVDHIVNEIIIVDGGSTDRTCEIVTTYPKVKLYHIAFNPRAGDRYDTQKNNAIALANSDWILLLDADEYLTSYVANAIPILIEESQKAGGIVDVFSFHRHTIVDGRLINPIELDYQPRLFKNYCRYGGHEIHANLINFNNCCNTNLNIIHNKTNAMQQNDNEIYWDKGQTPPEGWVKIDGKWTWTGA